MLQVQPCNEPSRSQPSQPGAADRPPSTSVLPSAQTSPGTVSIPGSGPITASTRAAGVQDASSFAGSGLSGEPNRRSMALKPAAIRGRRLRSFRGYLVDAQRFKLLNSVEYRTI